MNRTYLMVKIVTGVLFILLVLNILSNGVTVTIDSAVADAISTVQTPVLTTIFTIITSIVSLPFLTLLLVITSYFLYRRRKISDMLLLLLAVGTGWLVKEAVKAVVMRARPESGLVEATGYSFPSGHAVLATIFFGLLIYFYKDGIHDKLKKNMFVSSMVVLIGLIGFSRVYLGVHWLSDVIGGMLLGIFWIFLLVRAAGPLLAPAGKPLKST